MNNLLADLLIRQIFFRQRLKQSQFAKFFRHQTPASYTVYMMLGDFCLNKLDAVNKGNKI